MVKTVFAACEGKFLELMTVSSWLDAAVALESAETCCTGRGLLCRGAHSISRANLMQKGAAAVQDKMRRNALHVACGSNLDEGDGSHMVVTSSLPQKASPVSPAAGRRELVRFLCRWDADFSRTAVGLH